MGEIREQGAAEPAGGIVRSLEGPVLDGFWVYLDADVLDPSVMPAVDSPDAGGLLPGELGPLPRTLARSSRCAGLDVTVYDPDPGPDGTAGALLTDLVVAAFAEV